MRRADREVKDREQIRAIIDGCRVCHVGVTDQDGMYIVPMNFGYEDTQDGLVLYFHSAPAGRKIQAFRKNPQVCFEMDGGHGLTEGNTPCEYGYAFSSVMGTGTMVFVEDREEKKKALTLLMEHMTGEGFAIEDPMADHVTVLKLQVCRLTAKRRGIS